MRHGRPRDVLRYIQRMERRVSGEIVVNHHVEIMGPGRLPPPLDPPMAMAMQISQAEQDHHAMLRARSYALAIERGHIRR